MGPVALLSERQTDGPIRGEARTKIGDKQLSPQCGTRKIDKGDSRPTLQHSTACWPMWASDMVRKDCDPDFRCLMP